MTKKQKIIKAANKYVDDFPPNYDAVLDRFSTHDDHALNVNELLRHLRALLEVQ